MELEVPNQRHHDRALATVWTLESQGKDAVKPVR